MEAVSRWNGASGRFVVRRKGSDPTSRAWMTTMMQKRDMAAKIAESEANWPEVDEFQEATFLVCVHNVSPDHPYAILRVPVKSTAADVIAQVLQKSRGTTDASEFSLVEELQTQATATESGTVERKDSPGFRMKFGRPSVVKAPMAIQRILDDGELVYNVQRQWKDPGRLLLQQRPPNSPALKKGDSAKPPPNGSGRSLGKGVFASMKQKFRGTKNKDNN